MCNHIQSINLIYPYEWDIQLFFFKFYFSLDIGCQQWWHRQLEYMMHRSRYRFWSSASIGRKVIRILCLVPAYNVVADLSVSMATTTDCRCHCHLNRPLDCPEDQADWFVSLFGVDCKTILVPLPFPCTSDRQEMKSLRWLVSDSREMPFPMHHVPMFRLMYVFCASDRSSPVSSMDCLTYLRQKYSWNERNIAQSVLTFRRLLQQNK